MSWREHVRGDPLEWLLDERDPAVRAAALQRLGDLPPDAPPVAAARAAAMKTDPIATILANQHPEGWWVKPGPGYGPKYLGSVWQVVFLDQLGADPAHPQVRRAVDYLLGMCATTSGGFGCSSAKRELAPPPSAVIHCLNGNLLRAFLGFGRIDDPRVRAAVDWAARTITGLRVERWYASGTSGPLFRCAANDGQPCAWGALKELGALARVPTRQRSASVRRAIDDGVAFLFSRDPAIADYPMGWGNTKPNASWFKPGFPIGYVSDVLQTVAVLAELGHARDPRLGRALEWVESLQGVDGRWRNRYAYNGKTWVDVEKQGAPSKWVTLRACAVLKAAYG